WHGGAAANCGGRTPRTACSRRHVCSQPVIVAGPYVVRGGRGRGTRVDDDEDDDTSRHRQPFRPRPPAHARGADMTDPNTDVFSASLSELDPEVAEAMAGELARQRDTLEMIASENFVPRSVLQAQGSVLTNKYAEGYPGRRYYGGCEHVDVVENLARDRAKEVFGARYANVQPHAGAQA